LSNKDYWVVAIEKDKIIASNGIPTIHDPLIRIAKTQALDS